MVLESNLTGILLETGQVSARPVDCMK